MGIAVALRLAAERIVIAEAEPLQASSRDRVRAGEAGEDVRIYERLRTSSRRCVSREAGVAM
jgi:hypothetical protein